MKKTQFFLIIIVSSSLLSCRVLNSGADILMFGDSWAQLMCVFESFPKALHELGIKKTVSCLATTKSGTRASDWASPDGLKKIEQALDLHKRAKYIYISLGGNDFFSVWKKDMSFSDREEKFRKIQQDLIKIILLISSKRSDATIILNSYDYVDFGHLDASSVYDKPYIDLYQRLGSPSPSELHAAIGELELFKIEITKQFSNVKYVNNMGLMQYYYGLSEFNIPAYTTELPGQMPLYEPLLGGKPEAWGPHEALLAVSSPFIEYTNAYHFNSKSCFWFAYNTLMQVAP